MLLKVFSKHLAPNHYNLRANVRVIHYKSLDLTRVPKRERGRSIFTEIAAAFIGLSVSVFGGDNKLHSVCLVGWLDGFLTSSFAFCTLLVNYRNNYYKNTMANLFSAIPYKVGSGNDFC